MSVAGTDGTLEKRFEGSDLRGRVFGKTGFVNKVSALSGYLHARDDQWYVFSILMNGIPAGSNSEVKPLQEQIIKALDQSVGRGAPMAVTR
jgi:D-alanyl-D-alanine carboxypeptidase/D-alanyl-D-alanine-endopeptidase (penicillin-binding protein 4)